ncbi:MAG: sulfite exporter TauE/SafE family protein [Thiotrichales bacterium]|nr:sulfite exporter TauE/SafE family protein [Thiotrichales bacterium]
MIVLNLLIAFNLGIISTLHCWGMCGPIITAYSLGLRQEKQSPRYILIFNSGRISSYVIAGVLAGLTGAGFAGIIQDFHGQTVLQILAAIILICIGLHVAGWFPQFKRLESTGLVIWKLLQPLTTRLLPVDTYSKAFMSGAIWGWLPCGLVYSLLLWNLAQANAVSAGLNMLAFGFGTLPGMVAAGLTADRISEVFRRQNLKKLLGTVVILFGLFTLWISVHPLHAGHEQHDHLHHHP